MDNKRLKDIEMIFKELKSALQENKLSMDDFKSEIKQLTYTDNLQNNWRFNGNWYTFKNNEWIQGDPYQITESPLTLSKPSNDNSTKIAQPDFLKGQKTKKSSKKKPVLIFSGITVILLAALFFFVINKPKPVETDANKIKNQTSQAETAKPATKPTEVLNPNIYQFPPMQLFGKAPYIVSPPETTEEQKTDNKTIKDSPFIISSEIDAKILAIVSAFETRVKLIKGVKTSNEKGKLTKTFSGVFYGFNVSSSFIKKNDKIIKDQIVLTTPLKGIITVKNQKLGSIKNLDFEKLSSEIQKVGLKLEIEIDSANQQILAKFLVQKDPPLKILEHFLISSNGVGKVRLRSETEGLKKYLPQGSSVIEREIANKYEGYKTYFFHKIYNNKKQPLYIINSNGETILKIQIENNNFKTGRGISVGDSLGKLLAYYPDLLITVVENRIPYAYLKNTNIRFYLPMDKINFEKKIFPLDSEIVSIWLE